MFEAIAALISSIVNLGGSVNAGENAKYQRYLNDRNAEIYNAAATRKSRETMNLILIVSLCMMMIIIIYFLSKKNG